MSQPNDPNRTVDAAQPPHTVAGDVAAPPTLYASPGRVDLLEKIARGGMGDVLKGRDTDLGRDVAVKVLRDDRRNEGKLAQRFLEEARIAGRLQHPGVVPVYSLGWLPDGRPYFTMKLVKGRTLAELMAERKEPSQDRPRFLAVFEQVCQTLAYAHSKGVIHRDLKPSNIMVGAFGEVQVMDWGLAKVLSRDAARADKPEAPVAADVSVIQTPRGEDSDTGDSGSETRAGSVLGTPSYMAPEQARGEIEDVDRRSDVFGLGAILCEVLTGRPPFAGSGAAVLKQAARADLADAFSRLDGCGADAELIALAKRCLAAKAEERPHDAGEAATAMARHLAGVQERLQKAEVERAAAQAKTAEERKRRRMTAALAATVLLAATVGGAAVYWYQSEHARRAAATEHDVTAALGEATAFGNQAATMMDAPAKWEAALTEGLSAVKRAEGVLSAGEGNDELRRRVASVRTDLESADNDRRMAARLEEALLQNAQPGANGSGFDNEGSAAMFAAAFKEDMGLDLQTTDPDQAAERLNSRAIRNALLGGLDDWLIMSNPHDQQAIAKILRAADPAANSFRNHLNSAVLAKDRAALTRLAAGEEANNLSAVDVTALGRALGGVGAETEALKLLRKGQSRYPNAVWINFDLAQHLERAQPPAHDEAIRFLTVAMALHPESAGIHFALGTVFLTGGRSDEALVELRKAVELRPNFALAHLNLGVALFYKKQLDEAIQEQHRAIELDPMNALAHLNLGYALEGKKQPDEAIREYRRSIKLDPKYAVTHVNLGVALYGKNQLDEATREYRRAIELEPKYAQAYCGLGYALRDTGRLTESLDAFRTGHRLGSEQPGWPNPSGQWVTDAERLVELDRKLAAILDGKQPAEDAERLGLALFCQQAFKKFNAASARLYSEAFAHNAKLADDMPTGHRYNAACAAALAVAGQGKDADKLDGKERARLRQQAGEWLRADLAYWTKQAASDKPADRDRMRQTLKHWQEDSDLSSLRGAAELATLPADEQETCRKLWADVQTLLDKAGVKK